MNKQMRILLAAAAVLALCAGCGKKMEDPMKESTRPLATVEKPTETTDFSGTDEDLSPSVSSTRPAVTAEPVSPSQTTEPTAEQTQSVTIEDGNGPSASQESPGQ